MAISKKTTKPAPKATKKVAPAKKACCSKDTCCDNDFCCDEASWEKISLLIDKKNVANFVKFLNDVTSKGYDVRLDVLVPPMEEEVAPAKKAPVKTPAPKTVKKAAPLKKAAPKKKK